MSHRTSWKLPHNDEDGEGIDTCVHIEKNHHIHHIAYLSRLINTTTNKMYTLGEEGTFMYNSTITNNDHYLLLLNKYLAGYKYNKETKEYDYIQAVKLFEGIAPMDEIKKSYHEEMYDYIVQLPTVDHIALDKKYGSSIARTLVYHKNDYKKDITTDIKEDGSNMFKIQKKMWKLVRKNLKSRKKLLFYDKEGQCGKTQLANLITCIIVFQNFAISFFVVFVADIFFPCLN